MLKVISFCLFIIMVLSYLGCVKDSQINNLSEQDTQYSSIANHLLCEHSDHCRLRISIDKSVVYNISQNKQNETVIDYSIVEAIPGDKFGLVDLRRVSGQTGQKVIEKLLTFEYDVLNYSFTPNLKQNKA